MAIRTIRVYWPAMQGRKRVNDNWSGVINWRSVVVVTASEYSAIPPLQGTDQLNPPGGTVTYKEDDAIASSVPRTSGWRTSLHTGHRVTIRAE